MVIPVIKLITGINALSIHTCLTQSLVIAAVSNILVKHMEQLQTQLVAALSPQCDYSCDS